LSVVTGRTTAEVNQALESELIRAWALNAPDELFAQHGGQHPLGAGFAGGQDLLPHDWDEQTALSHIKAISPALQRDVGLVGTPDEVIDRAAEWRDCGVRYIVVANLSSMQRSMRAGIAANAQFSKIVRGLKKLYPLAS
jgi:phthiodiolone/phenolphthiodiolone dimycocerosates ketoreductase